MAYLFYIMEVMLCKSKFGERSLFKFIMGGKAAKTIFSINKPFGLEIAMKEGTGMGQEVLFFFFF